MMDSRVFGVRDIVSVHALIKFTPARGWASFILITLICVSILLASL